MGKGKIVTSCLTIVCAFVLSTTFGQKELSWDDFQGTPIDTGSISSYLDYDLSYVYTKKVINDTSIIYYQATTTIDPSSSWVKKDSQNQKELILNQTKAIILESYRIKTQFFLDTVEHPLMIDSEFPIILEALNTKIDSIEQNYTSKSITELKSELESTKQKLNGRPQNTIPEFTANNIGLGIHLGLGVSLFSENLNNYFTHPLILTLGGDLTTKRINYNLSGTVGWNKTKKSFTNEYEWSDDFGTSTISFETNIGYNLITSKIKLIPYVGLSYFGIITLTGQKQNSSGQIVNQYNRYTTLTPNIGFIIDYNTKTTISLLPSYANHSKKYSELNIRLKISASPIDFNNNITGTLFNTTIGISTLRRSINLK